MRPYEMDSVLIVGPKNIQERISKELHKLKILHIVSHTKSELADIGHPFETANMLSDLLVKTRGLMTSLKITKEDSNYQIKNGISEIESTTKKLNEEVNLFFEQEKRTDELIVKSEAAQQELNILKDIDIPVESFTDYKSLTYFTGYLGKNNDVKILKDELSEITNKFMLLDSDTEKGIFIAIFVDMMVKDDINAILRGKKFSPITFSNIDNLK